MIQRTLKKLTESLVLAMMLCMIAASVCFAEEKTREEFITISQEDLEDIEKLSAYYLYGENEQIRQDYVFLGSKTVVSSGSVPENTTVTEEIYDKVCDLTTAELLIGSYRTDNDSSLHNIITIRYSASEETALAFEKADGSQVSIDEMKDVSSRRTADGYVVLTMDLGWDQLREISYFSQETFPAVVLKPVSTNGSLVVQSVSIASSKGGYGIARLMEGVTDYASNFAILQYTAEASVPAAVCYELSEDTLHIQTSEGLDLNFMDIVKVYSSETEDSAELNGELVTLLAGMESGSITEEEIILPVAVEDTLSMDEDIEESSYADLNDGAASTIYTDSCLFTEDGGLTQFYREAGSLGLDCYLNVYGLRGFVGKDLPVQMEELTLLGAAFDACALPAGSVVLTVSNVRDSVYAGQMDLRLEGEETGTTRKIVHVASPSDASRNENDAISQPAEETEQSEVEASTELIQTAEAPRTVLFYKADGSAFAVETGTTILSEAFLKKASWCAVDAEGVVCAFYNEHGRLLELAEGYTEEDIAGFLLLPYAEQTEEGEEDLYLSELSITYNDVLAMDGNYAAVSYKDENGIEADPDMTVSSYIDMDAYLDLQLSADYSSQAFYLLADGVEAELQADLFGDFTLSSMLEAETTMEQNLVEGSEVEEDTSEEIIRIDEMQTLDPFAEDTEAAIAESDNAEMDADVSEAAEAEPAESKEENNDNSDDKCKNEDVCKTEDECKTEPSDNEKALEQENNTTEDESRSETSGNTETSEAEKENAENADIETTDSSTTEINDNTIEKAEAPPGIESLEESPPGTEASEESSAGEKTLQDSALGDGVEESRLNCDEAEQSAENQVQLSQAEETLNEIGAGETQASECTGNESTATETTEVLTEADAETWVEQAA